MTDARPDRPTAQDYRAKIERELAERLAGAQPAGGAAAVKLLCLACRSINDGDAHFCASCGTAFNALVIAGPAGRRTA
jgi:hypothetical protein